MLRLSSEAMSRLAKSSKLSRGRVSKNLTKGGSLAKLPISLAPWQSEAVTYVSGVVQLFGLPPSVGAIYGVLFASSGPLCLSEITALLKISKGSASQGIRQLREVGAVIPVSLPGKRPEFYKPELSLKKLVAGFLRDRVRPSLESSDELLGRIEKMPCESSDRELVAARVNTLRVWSRKANETLPLLELLLGEQTGL